MDSAQFFLIILLFLIGLTSTLLQKSSQTNPLNWTYYLISTSKIRLALENVLNIFVLCLIFSHLSIRNLQKSLVHKNRSHGSWNYLHLPSTIPPSSMAKSFSLPSLPFNSPHSITSHLPKISCSSTSIQSQSAKRELLTLISDQERGLKTQRNPQKLALIVKSVDALASLARNSVTTDDSLSATWRLLWTTEKEQLFIVEKAHLFGTQAGDVLQVIDVEKRSLNNVITFPPDGVFFVRSTIEIASSQRVDFRCVFV